MTTALSPLYFPWLTAMTYRMLVPEPPVRLYFRIPANLIYNSFLSYRLFPRQYESLNFQFWFLKAVETSILNMWGNFFFKNDENYFRNPISVRYGTQKKVLMMILLNGKVKLIPQSSNRCHRGSWFYPFLFIELERDGTFIAHLDTGSS